MHSSINVQLPAIANKTPPKFENADTLKEHFPNNTSSVKIDKNYTAIELLKQKVPEVDKRFNIIKKVGEGTFSNVLLATSKTTDDKKKLAIKHLFPTSHPSRILQELKCLTSIGGCCNVVGLIECIRNLGSIVFIMPYFRHDSFSKYYLDMTVDETRVYMKNLLIALERVHSYNVIHRDIKPNNFLYNRKDRRFLLVDFGLSSNMELRGKKRQLHLDSPEKDYSSGNASKRPVLHSRSINIEGDTDSPPHSVKRCKTSNQKNLGPLYKENSSLPKQSSSHRDVKNVKRNLQFDGMTDLKTTVVGETLKNSSINVSSLSITNVSAQSPKSDLSNNSSIRISLSPANSTLAQLQNSQSVSRYSISGQVIRDSFSSSRKSLKCDCTGKPKICTSCIIRKPMVAPRAGTAGYRPPEVLLKYPNQTTAIDIWAAGIIMLSIMSGSFPFFRAPDDLTALMEIMTIFGTDSVKEVAEKLGRKLLTNHDCKPINLRMLCELLQSRKKDEGKVKISQPSDVNPGQKVDDIQSASLSATSQSNDNATTTDDTEVANRKVYPDLAYDLLSKLLAVDPFVRYSATKALKHPFFNGAQ